MHEQRRNRGDLDIPAHLAHETGHLLGTFLLGALTAVTDQHRARLEDDEITTLEMPGSGVAPDRDIVLLVKLDHRVIIGAPTFELHVADERTPRRHRARIARKKVTVQHRVRFEVVAGDTGILVDAHHFLVLALRQIEIELHTGLVHVVERAANQGPGFHPPEVVGLAEQHIAQHAIVVIDSPVIRIALVGHVSPPKFTGGVCHTLNRF